MSELNDVSEFLHLLSGELYQQAKEPLYGIGAMDDASLRLMSGSLVLCANVVQAVALTVQHLAAEEDASDG